MELRFLPIFTALVVPMACLATHEDPRFSPLDLAPKYSPGPDRFWSSAPQWSPPTDRARIDKTRTWSYLQTPPNRSTTAGSERAADNAREVDAKWIAPNTYAVNIRIRVHWKSGRGSRPRFYRDAGTQRDYDRKAEAAWSGVFRHRHMFKTLATYFVTTEIISTYGDEGAPYPDKSSTVVLQINNYGGACAFAPRGSGAGKYGSIMLHKNSRPSDYVHEIGHALGCVDRYESGAPEPGWENNVMANQVKLPDYRNIEEILENSSLPELPSHPPLLTRDEVRMSAPPRRSSR
jgi:hypothetical protein